MPVPDPVPAPVPAPDPALGPTHELTPLERNLYIDPDAFAPLPPPARNSWRHRVDEPTQSFADFVVSRPNPVSPPRSRLYLRPWGAFPHEVIVEQEYVAIVRSPELAALADFAARFFQIPCEPLPARPWEPGAMPLRIRGGHDQIDAHAVLAAAGEELPDDAYAMAVLVNRDLYYDDAQQYAFGYGTHRERLAVMSFARFDPQFAGHAREESWRAQIVERSLKVLAHELAHTFGLRHCTWYACILNGFAHSAELDATPLSLCPVCLRKLAQVTGFDPVRRYQALGAFYEDAGLHEPARWVNRRLRRLAPHHS